MTAVNKKRVSKGSSGLCKQKVWAIFLGIGLGSDIKIASTRANI